MSANSFNSFMLNYPEVIGFTLPEIVLDVAQFLESKNNHHPEHKMRFEINSKHKNTPS